MSPAARSVSQPHAAGYDRRMAKVTDVISQVERDALQSILDQLRTLPDALRQTLADHLFTLIPVPIDEFNASDSLAAGTALELVPQTQGLEVINSVTACVPAGATAVLVLGSQRLFLPAGITNLTGLQKTMFTSDRRALTCTVTGPAALWLSGEQRPTYGVLAH